MNIAGKGRARGIMPMHLFVYGTLHPDRAPDEIAAVVRQMEPCGGGSIRARMHRFPDYPAIRLDLEDGAQVEGQIFTAPNEAALRALDKYEAFYPGDSVRSLFRRVPADVTCTDGSRLRCWVYEYDGELPQDTDRNVVSGG